MLRGHDAVALPPGGVLQRLGDCRYHLSGGGIDNAHSGAQADLGPVDQDLEAGPWSLPYADAHAAIVVEHMFDSKRLLSAPVWRSTAAVGRRSTTLGMERTVGAGNFKYLVAV